MGWLPRFDGVNPRCGVNSCKKLLAGDSLPEEAITALLGSLQSLSTSKAGVVVLQLVIEHIPSARAKLIQHVTGSAVDLAKDAAGAHAVQAALNFADDAARDALCVALVDGIVDLCREQ